MPSRLHLLLPGLLWPAGDARPPLQGLALPGLDLATARSRRTDARFPSWEALLAGLLGAELRHTTAALRLGGEASAAPPRPGVHLLCADPGHLRFSRDTLVLVPAGALDIDRAEADALMAALNAEFPDVGRFHAPHPERWYVELTAPTQADFTPVAFAAGRNVQLLMPAGADERRWRRVMNEIQVLLHGHPVNTEREARGLPAINTVWLWGGNVAQTPAVPLAARRPAALHTHDALARGIATHAGLPHRPPPARAQALEAETAGHHLVVLDDLREPFATRDADAWRQALARLDADWFEPLWQAMRAGRLAGLTLSALGDDVRRDFTLRRADTLRFWRRGDLAQALVAATP